jgi:hypothetical protein
VAKSLGRQAFGSVGHALQARLQTARCAVPDSTPIPLSQSHNNAQTLVPGKSCKLLLASDFLVVGEQNGLATRQEVAQVA